MTEKKRFLILTDKINLGMRISLPRGFSIWGNVLIRSSVYFWITSILLVGFFTNPLSPFFFEKTWLTVHRLNQDIPPASLSEEEWLNLFFVALARIEGKNGGIENFPEINTIIIETFLTETWPPETLRVSGRVPRRPSTSRITVALQRDFAVGGRIEVSRLLEIYIDITHHGQKENSITRIAVDTTGGEPPTVIYRRR